MKFDRRKQMLGIFIIMASYSEVQSARVVEPEKLETFRKWVKSKDYLPDVSDDLLEAFIFKNKDANNSDTLIQRNILEHFKIQHDLPLVFKNRSVKLDPNILNTMKAINAFKLPGKAANGDTVVCLSLNPEANYTLSSTLKLFNLLMDFVIKDKETEGISLLVDLKKVTMATLMSAGTQLGCLQTFARYMQWGLPTTVNSAHMLNGDPLITNLSGCLQSTIGKDKMDKWKSYTPEDMSNLYKVIPKEIIPQDFGGNGQTVEKQTADQYELLREFDGNEPEVDASKIERLNADLCQMKGPNETQGSACPTQG